MKKDYSDFMLKLCIALMLCASVFVVSKSSADEIVLHGLSYHMKPSEKLDGYDYKFNQRNYGLGYRKEFGSFDLQAGFYKNSYFRQARYFIADWMPVEFYGAKFGVFIGEVTGYAHVSINHYPPLMPVAGLIGRYRVNRIDFAVRAIPPTKAKDCGVISFEVGINF